MIFVNYPQSDIRLAINVKIVTMRCDLLKMTKKEKSHRAFQNFLLLQIVEIKKGYSAF